MNKLEQEIEEKLPSISPTIDCDSCFKQGAQFILDKNLAVEFAKHILENWPDSINTSVEEEYKDWINNVYGL